MENNNIVQENKIKAVVFMCETADMALRSFFEHNNMSKEEIDEYILKNADINFFINSHIYDAMVLGDMIHPRITGSSV